MKKKKEVEISALENLRDKAEFDLIEAKEKLNIINYDLEHEVSLMKLRLNKRSLEKQIKVLEKNVLGAVKKLEEKKRGQA